MMQDKNQRVALVTGGTRGIGEAVSRALLQAGMTVIATYHSNDHAAQAFARTSGITGVYKWDVGDFDACAKGVKTVEEHHGPIDILVNNAGITADATLHKMQQEQWSAVIHTNLNSCFNMCRNVIEGMRDRRYGRIVNISSINGQKGQFGQTNYAAAKAGILGFTKALALETAHCGVKVHAVAPGYTETDMVSAVPEKVRAQIIEQIPVGRLGHPDEIARAVRFLASEDAGFVTGATFSLNGGQYMA